MTHGDALVTALGATMALILASSALRSSPLSRRAQALMALSWVLLIAGISLVAARWH